ncbi:hypothetical protein QBC40DRAFT_270612 [Triangularia verruculosa]|uniref:AT hook domain-containing protein n=1 Tax=Triangularia verruculosa TaxID=2587418 RepID=A0AAN6XXW5_9PEZI|nr:hypothetical protein QBC40DRAFT_270612 [Triangularia verruculosa]
MAPREILDSEDDGDDFDDQEYGADMIPIAGAAPEPEDVPEQQQATAAPPLPSAINNVQVTNTSTLSTDPSFFERVYEGQHIGWEGQFLQTTSDDISTQIPSMPPSTRKATRAKAATQKQAENNDIVDLTTPRKAADASVWDFPGSSLPPTAEPGAAAASSSVRSTRSARKRTQVVEAQDEDPYAFPASTPARSSKRTRRSLSAAAETSPVALVPNTTTEMYVATSELTPSQKEQYATVSLPNSSTSEAGVPLPTLPLQVQGTEVHKSSGMTLTTIAYTTPSRIGSSSRREMPSTGGVGGENATPAGYQSSPDVLNDMAPPSTSSSKRKGRGKTDMEPPSSTTSGRKTKKRRTSQNDDEDGDFGAENDHGHILEATSNEVIPQTEPEQQPEPQAEPQPKKKRGRKKKEPVPQAVETVPGVELSEVYQPDTSVSTSEGQVAPVPDMMEPEMVPETMEPAAEPEPAPVVEEQPPAKKKRGRPKKADTVAKTQPVVIDVEDGASGEVREPLADMPTNSQPKGKKAAAAKGKGGRKKKEVVVDSDEDGENGDGEWGEKQQEEPVKEKQAVEEVVTETKVEMKSEVKKVKDEKPAAGATPIKPAGYRVGLSKRSRIAPLLKSLRKT